jgi:hypothetical protein
MHTTRPLDTLGTLPVTSFNRGMSLEAIAALLGHKTMTMTLVYANPRKLHQTGEANVLFRQLVA